MTSDIIKRPMLAARELSEETAHKLRYPLWGSYKLDGIRALVYHKEMVSRSFKPIRSSFAQEKFCDQHLNGFDGELIYGSPNDPRVFNMTTSAVMTMGNTEIVDYYVFDAFLSATWATTTPYEMRAEWIRNQIEKLPSEISKHTKWVEQKQLNNWEDILEFEQGALVQGYEGLILRDPKGIYKYGRSTFKEQLLIKLKRLQDGEAIVIDFVEKCRNENEAVIDALGYQKRSSSLEGKIPVNTLGTLVVRDIVDGTEFELGSGFDDVLRKQIWSNKEAYKGKLVSYKHFPVGRIDKPRQPIFKGFRSLEDM